MTGSAKYLSKKLSITSLVLVNFLSVTCLIAAQETTQQAASPEAEQAVGVQPKWPVNLKALSKKNSADDFFWLGNEQENLLVLKYWAKGSKYRGNIILVHAQGENADHPRLTLPLATQLSHFGWQVFSINLPLEDFPVEIKKETDAPSQKNPETKSSAQPQEKESETKQANKNSFFADAGAYQNYLTQSIQKTIEQIQPKMKNLVVIANKRSAYWVLESAKNNAGISQIVLIEPELPEVEPSLIEENFKAQKLPVYSFIKNKTQSAPFIKAFDKKLWKADHQRFNLGLLTNRSLDLEDTRIAKMISGWVEAQQKKK